MMKDERTATAQAWRHERMPGPPVIDHDPRAFHRSGLSIGGHRRLHVDRLILAAIMLGIWSVGFVIGWVCM
jgi:hypothetical protein